MEICRAGLKWFICVTFFLVYSAAIAEPPQEKRLHYLDLQTITAGLSATETGVLKDFFDNSRAVDLEKSGFTELSNWLEELNARLTSASEKIGNYFGTYRVFVVPIEDWGHIYRYRPEGLNFFRAYIFISTHTLERFCASLGVTNPSQLSDEQLDIFLDGLTGIASHQFASPQESELISWHNQNRNPLFQSTSIATDMVALHLLREASFPIQNILTGFELLHGFKPSREQETSREYTIRIGESVLKNEPDGRLRINIIRAALLRDNIAKGIPTTTQIAYNAPKLREELQTLTELAALPAGKHPNPIIALIEGLTAGMHNYGQMWPERYLRYLDKIHELLEKRGTPPLEEEVEAMISFMHVLVEHTSERLSDNLALNYPTFPRSEPIFRRYLPAFPIRKTRKAQRTLRQISFFSHPLFEKWLEDGLDNPSSLFDMKGESAAGYQSLPQILPMKHVLKVYQAVYLNRRKSPPLERAQHLVEMLHGNISGGGNVGLDLKLVLEIQSLCERSNKITAAIAETMQGLLFALPRAVFQSRFIEYNEKFPEKRGALLHAYATLVRHLMDNPELRLERAFDLSHHQEISPALHRVSEILTWDLIPDSFPQAFNAKSGFPTEDIFNYYSELLQSDPWRKIHLPVFRTPPQELYPNLRIFHSIAAALVTSNDTAFTPEQRLKLLQIIEGRYLLAELGMTEDDPKYINIRALLYRQLGLERSSNSKILIEGLVEWYRDSNCSNPQDFFQRIKLATNDKIKSMGKLFEENRDAQLLFFHRLRSEGLISQSEWGWGVRESLLPTGAHHNLVDASPDVMRQLWSACKEAGIEGIDFLKMLQTYFDVEPNKNLGAKVAFRPREERRNDETIAVGAKHHPQYYSSLATIGGLVESDFLKLLGVRRSDSAYDEIFVQHFDEALRFFRHVFNADGTPMLIHLRSMYSTSRLDDLTPKFLNLIPEQGLTSEQKFQLWLEVAAKRSNRYTDAFFESNIANFLEQFSPNERLSKFEFLLRHDYLHSERLKVLYTKQIFEGRIAEAERRKQISDRELYKILSEVQYYCPRSSRFRDDFLEQIAGRLRLKEGQLIKFIEPSKSFNYASINPLVVNLLSGLVVYLEKVSPRERMDLTRYIREPRGEIIDKVPSLEKVLKQLDAEARDADSRLDINYWEFIEQLESLIRDAGETERHILLELMIGTPEIGIWHQNQASREELFAMMGMPAGSPKRQILDAHLAARPSYQHSLIVSYLLADNEANQQELDLVRTLENFRAPGKKAADIFGVLGVFPEHREALLKMKGWTLIPSRYDTFQWLKAVYPESTYNQIADIQVLGGGAIKVVVLVIFKDGSKIVASLKRPYIEDTNRSNISLFRDWINNLRKLPQWENKFDYGYLVDLLERQLEMDSDFVTEFKNMETLNALYLKAKPKQGWSFSAVKPASSSDFPQNAEVMHFTAIENPVRYEALPEPDRKAAAELILEHELYLLLELGIFEAERLSSNYLFSLHDHKVYAIDTPQLYRLEGKSYLKTDDRMLLAQIFRGLFSPIPKQGAREIVAACSQLGESVSPTGERDQQRIEDNLLPILKLDIPVDDKMAQVVAELHRSGVRLPARFTLGVVKALTILSHEEYSKDVPPDFIQNRVAAFVRKQSIRQGVGDFIRKPLQWVAASCQALITKASQPPGQ